MSEEKQRQSPFRVRSAELKDLDVCVKLALEIPLENDLGYFPAPSKTKVRATLEALINERTLIVYENNGIIVGILGLIIDSFWWSDQPMMMDMLFYIQPEFRSYKAFNRMLSTAEEFAKINGLPLSLLVFTTKDMERKFKMIQKRGYKSVGFWMVRERE